MGFTGIFKNRNAQDQRKYPCTRENRQCCNHQRKIHINKKTRRQTNINKVKERTVSIIMSSKLLHNAENP